MLNSNFVGVQVCELTPGWPKLDWLITWLKLLLASNNYSRRYMECLPDNIMKYKDREAKGLQFYTAIYGKSRI